MGHLIQCQYLEPKQIVQHHQEQQLAPLPSQDHQEIFSQQ